MTDYEDETYDVRDVTYRVHKKRGADDDHPKTMRAEYRLGLDYSASEWVCVEHRGFARSKAEDWWKARSSFPVPDRAFDAVEIANAGGLAAPERVTVRNYRDGRWPDVVDVWLGPIPEPCELAVSDYDDDVPF